MRNMAQVLLIHVSGPSEQDTERVREEGFEIRQEYIRIYIYLVDLEFIELYV